MLQTVGVKALPKKLLAQQLLMFGRAARSPQESSMFKSTLGDVHLRPVADLFVRKRGKPQLEWTQEVRKTVLHMTGSNGRMRELVQDSLVWRHAVYDFVS